MCMNCLCSTVIVAGRLRTRFEGHISDSHINMTVVIFFMYLPRTRTVPPDKRSDTSTYLIQEVDPTHFVSVVCGGSQTSV